MGSIGKLGFDNQVSLNIKRLFPSVEEDKSLTIEWNKCILLSNDRNKVERLIDEIIKENELNIAHHIEQREDIVLMLKDGKEYRWLKPNMKIKGHWCNKLYVDININIEELMMAEYVGRHCVMENVDIF